MSRYRHFIEQLRSCALQPCIQDAGGCNYRYSDLLQELSAWHSRFDELSIAPGTVVGLRSDYSFSGIAALLALLSRDAIAALIPRSGPVERYVGDAHVKALLELSSDGSVQWHCPSSVASHPLLERLRAQHEGGVIIFTSGSSGTPKAALQSIERFLYKFQKPGRSFRTIAFLLFDHVGGLDTLFYTLASGGTLILPQRRDPESILDLIEAHRAEVLPTSPSFLRSLCVIGERRKRDLSSLKIITYGSEPMDESTLARLNASFPNARLTQKYGTTETGSPRSVSRSNDSLWLKIKSDEVDAKVVDGVLWLRGEATMLGYLNAPSPVDEHGWYCTGDLVDVDGEWIRFRGRLSDILNVGGEKVAPVEVEQTILQLDFVRDVSVAGEPHPLVGSVVVARVALHAKTLSSKEAVRQILRHCRAHLARHKVPVRIDFVDGDLVNDRQKAQRTRAVRPSGIH